MPDMYKPPAGAASAANKALKWRDEHGSEVKAGTQVGWTRANQLSKREEISLDTVKRMHSFFSRHEGNQNVSAENKDTPWKDNGYVAWLLWGGNAGKTWAAGIVNSNKNESLEESMELQESKKVKVSSIKKGDMIWAPSGMKDKSWGEVVEVSNKTKMDGSKRTYIKVKLGSGKIVEIEPKSDMSMTIKEEVELQEDHFTKAQVDKMIKHWDNNPSTQNLANDAKEYKELERKGYPGNSRKRADMIAAKLKKIAKEDNLFKGMKEEVEELDEAISRAERIKRGMRMRRKSNFIQRRKEIASRRPASREKLMKRARKAARQVLTKRFSRKSPGDMSPAEKARIEDRLKKMSPAVDRIAKKMLPKVKKRAMERLAAKRKQAGEE